MLDGWSAGSRRRVSWPPFTTIILPFLLIVLLSLLIKETTDYPRIFLQRYHLKVTLLREGPMYWMLK